MYPCQFLALCILLVSIDRALGGDPGSLWNSVKTSKGVAPAWTTAECIGKVHSRTCLFENLLFIDGKFWAFFLKGTPLPLWTQVDYMSNEDRSSGYTIDWMFFDSVEHIAEKIVNLSTTVYPQLSVYADCYFGNPGHLLMDCLYTSFVAMQRFYPEPETKMMGIYNLLGGRGSGCDVTTYENYECKHLSTILPFFGFGLLHTKPLSGTTAYLFRKVIIGTEGLGVNSLHADMMTGHNTNYSLQLFRNRLYRSFLVPVPTPIPANMDDVVTAVIFRNKRYTAADERVLAQFMDVVNEKPDKYKVRIFYEGHIIGGKAENTVYIWKLDYKERLMEYAKAAIYISGPGTGGLQHFLLPDGSVSLNLGGIFSDCRVPPAQGPLWMDVGIAGSAWTYQTSVYYNGTTRHRGLELEEMLRLIRVARGAVGRNKELVKSPRDNMPPEGKIMFDLCSQGPRPGPCQEYFDARNSISTPFKTNKFRCFMYRYPEFAVHEICPYRRAGEGKDGYLLTVTKGSEPEQQLCPTLPLAELRRLRESPEFYYDIVHWSWNNSISRDEFDGKSIGADGTTWRTPY